MKKYKDETYIKQRYSYATKQWTFQVDISYQDYSGEKKRHIKSFNEKNFNSTREAYNEAIKYRDEFVYAYNKGYIPSNKTVIEMYNKFKSTSALSFETLRKKDISFAKIPHNIQTMELSKVKAYDIQYTISKVIEDGASTGVAKDLLTLWKQIYNIAIINDVVQIDQTVKVTIPNSRVPIVKREVSTNIDTVNRVIELLSLSKGTEQVKFKNKLIIYAIKICWLLGLRPSECYALDKQSIDFKNHLVHITKATGTITRNVTTIRSTKTDNSYRTLPMNDEVESVFRELFEIQDDDYLFMYNGNVLNSSIVADKIKRVCRKEGINFTMYQLRHQFSTDLILSGEDVRTVMELMGHNNSSMTIDYARSNENAKRNAINKKSLEKTQKNAKIF